MYDNAEINSDGFINNGDGIVDATNNSNFSANNSMTMMLTAMLKRIAVAMLKLIMVIISTTML